MVVMVMDKDLSTSRRKWREREMYKLDVDGKYDKKEKFFLTKRGGRERESCAYLCVYPGWYSLSARGVFHHT